MTRQVGGDGHADRPIRVMRGLVGALLATAIIVPSVPSAPVAGQRPRGDDAAGWSARRIGAASHVRAADRSLLRRLPDAARVGYHPATKRVRFLSGTREAPLLAASAAVASGRRRFTLPAARDRARAFVDRYGVLFGLDMPERELRIAGTTRSALPADQARPGSAARREAAAATSDARRPVTVRFEQLRRGVPVMGGQLAVQVSEDGAVLSVSGEAMPSETSAVTRPRTSEPAARRTAAAWMARLTGRSSQAVRIASEGLALYDPRIMDDPTLSGAGPRLVWRIEASVTATAKLPADARLVLVDALGGDVLTSISRVATVTTVRRFICDNRARAGLSYRCDGPYARTEGEPSTGIRDVDAAYRLLGVVVEYLESRFGRDGLDAKGARMKATVRYCSPYGCPWRNAEWKWREQQAIFGVGWSKADDIVAHEMTHGLLDHEVPLFYHFQSGAINESMADVFGELIDLSYPGGTDTARSAWRIGEDTPIGAFRDMQSPRRHGHPDRVRSPRWHTGASDDGGVHRNSGVGNKAAYLIADGGSFNGRSVKGIGRTRTARLYYQAITTRLTPAANYVDLGDALIAACTDLVGTFGFLPAHCAAVRDATRATQMHLAPRNAPRQAPLCAAGKRPADVLFDDLEDPESGIWISERLVGTKRGWYYPQNPNNDPAWDGTWASSGRYNLYAPNRASRSDTVMRLRSGRLLPERAYLRFEHGYGFDVDARRRYDGGVVEIKVGSGRWRGVAGLFTHGGYNGRIARGTGNPLAGRMAYTANSRGWSSARIDLSAFAGKTVKVRFRVASDRAHGGRGWYIDDIRIYTCANDDDRPQGSLAIEGGADSTTDPIVGLALTWSDATTWVTHMRVSGSGRVDERGNLATGLVTPARGTYTWDLADRTFGGTGEPGTRRVFAQVRDAAGNWSEVFEDSIELLPA